jgi:hypothetical protein
LKKNHSLKEETTFSCSSRVFPLVTLLAILATRVITLQLLEIKIIAACTKSTPRFHRPKCKSIWRMSPLAPVDFTKSIIRPCGFIRSIKHGFCVFFKRALNAEKIVSKENLTTNLLQKGYKFAFFINSLFNSNYNRIHFSIRIKTVLQSN